MINYTFIIPHKNCPNLLKRCVDSIPERDDVQIIIVDDNSDEGKKPSIARNGVEVMLLDAEHSKGAGRARNVGLEHAEGKWLLFADADDYYTDFLPVLLDKYANDENTDIVYLNACMFDEDGNERPHKTEKLIQNYIKGERNAEMHLKYNLWTPWSRMVKKSIVTSHNLKFDELPAGNDKMFCLYCSRYSTRMTAALDVTYRYYRSSKGSQTDKNRANMFDGLIDVRCRTIKLFLEVGYEPKPSLLKLILNSKYNKGISKLKLFKLYWKSLNRANYSFFPDFCSFLTNRE